MVADDGYASADLFPETIALAVWIILYTLLSAACALFTHILFRLNKQKAVFVSLLCFSIFVQQCITIIQQAVSLSRWRELQVEVWRADIDMWRNPNASIVYQTNPDLFMRIIFAIRVYFFNVESLLFFFWSLLLCLSLWEVAWSWPHNHKFISATRYACFVVPALQVIIVNLPPVKEQQYLHLILSNFIMVITMTVGAFLLVLVLVKLVLVAMSSKRKRPTMRDDRRNSRNSKEDRWLMLRFLLSFLVLVALQTSFLYSQYDYAMTVENLKKPDAPFPFLGWTRSEQLKDWAYYMGGSSTGILIALVFGTTPESRSQAKRLWRMNCSGFRAGKRSNKGSFTSLSSRPGTSSDGDFGSQHNEKNVESGPAGGEGDIHKSERNSQTSEKSKYDVYDANDYALPLALSPPAMAVAEAQNFLTFPQPQPFQHPQPAGGMTSPQSGGGADGINGSGVGSMGFIEMPPLPANAYRQSTYRNFNTSYEDEYHHQVTTDTATTTTTTISALPTAIMPGPQQPSEPYPTRANGRDVVISHYDYRGNMTPGRREALKNEIVSPLTPEMQTYPAGLGVWHGQEGRSDMLSPEMGVGKVGYNPWVTPKH